MLPIICIVFFLIMAFLILVDTFMGEKTFDEIRQEQTIRKNQDEGIREKIDEYTRKKVKFNKRYEIETLCMNAGYRDMKYSDLLIINVMSACAMFVVFGVILQNIFLGIIMALVAIKLPIQILTMIKNKRLAKIEEQIGVFMNMTTKRYINTSNFEKSLILTTEEFKGIEPMYSELKYTVAEIQVGVNVGEALDNLARRTSNQYLKRFSDFYKIAYRLGTQEVREKLLTQAYTQYEENRQIKAFMKKEIAEPVRDSYIMVVTVPVFFLFGVLAMPGYSDFMFHTNPGKITLGIVVAIILGVIWFINKKVGAPLDEIKKK